MRHNTPTHVLGKLRELFFSQEHLNGTFAVNRDFQVVVTLRHDRRVSLDQATQLETITVMLIYQNDLTHHAVHLNDTLEQELQRLTWHFDAGYRPTHGELDDQSQTTHDFSKARLLAPGMWSWTPWTQPRDGDGQNTLYTQTLTCEER